MGGQGLILPGYILRMSAEPPAPLSEDEQILALTAEATRLAYRRTLEAGQPVTIARDRKIWMIFPGGREECVGEIAAPAPSPPAVRPGVYTYRLRRRA